MKDKTVLYMVVTGDEFELPVAVADTIQELADMIGKDSNAISSAMSRAKKKGYKCIYVKVILDE